MELPERDGSNIESDLSSTNEPNVTEVGARGKYDAYPTESMLFESSRHRFNWSTEFPTDVKKNTRKNTIYQLMLDSRVELKNGGNKISSTKPAGNSCSHKKRKKQQSGSLTENGLPDMASRSPLVTNFELAINSFQPHKLRGYFETYADPNIAFQVDMSAVSPNPAIMIYREIKGLNAVLSYLNVYNQVIPDAVQLYWQKSSRKSENGCKEIETDCRVIGTKFYNIDVIEESNLEQQILEEAIFGLTSLSKSQAEGDLPTKITTTAQITPECDATRSSNSSSPLPSVVVSSTTNEINTNSSSGNSSSSYTAAAAAAASLEGKASSINPNKIVRTLESINIFMGNDKVIFEIGKRLDKPQVLDLCGKFVWYLNNQKKIYRLKFTLCKKEQIKW